jgi:WS/DGAT/MGAT family acyltransferase
MCPISPQRRVSTATIELDRVSALAEASGTTLNDIVLALCSTALRRYLQDLDELPAQPLTAMCPVSVRPADGEAEGNAVSMILASLATDEADPVARLRVIAASTAAGKKHLRSLDKAALTAYSSLAMAPHFARQLVPGAARTRPMFNVVISNVPGPRRPLYAAGARMESFFPVSLLFKNEALNITVLSYDGHLNFGFTADRSALPHVQDLAVYTVQALDELEDRTSVLEKCASNPAHINPAPMRQKDHDCHSRRLMI